MSLSPYQEIFEKEQDRFIGELSEFLRFKSISTDSAYEKDCRGCAEWLSGKLKALGFTVELMETPGKPLVFAERAGEPGKPTVVFYGHYDVQPVVPLELWKTPPFEPAIRDGRVYARGAQDNKGQVWYLLKAIEALIARGALTCGMKILIEGEEETGSKGIAAVLPAVGPRIKADVLMVCDTGVIDSRLSFIMLGLRGLVSAEVRLKGPLYDLHSGVHGGVTKNPATEIARLIATLHNPDGSVAVPGFYDGVDPIDPADRALANAMPIDPAWYKAQTGMEPTGGEQGYTIAERRGFRPTVEINGIYGGYAGEGNKTIIPSYAGAKISCRIVKSQDPAGVLAALLNHLREHAPKDLGFEVVHTETIGGAFRGASQTPLMQRALAVLKEVTPTGAFLNWEGASIPIVAALKEASGAEALLVGYGLEEDCIHAPNESFAIDQFRKGFLYACGMLESISSMT